MMYKITQLILVLIGVVILTGCPGSKEPDQLPDTTISPSGVTPPSSTGDALSTGDSHDDVLAITDEPPLPISQLSQLPVVKEVLDRMVQTYQQCRSYSDQGVLRPYIMLGDRISDPQPECALAFERPNKLRFNSPTCTIVADGTTISVFIPSLTNTILQRPCPEKLTLDTVLFDPEILQAITLSQPGSFSVLPLQWVLLLADDPLKTLTNNQTEMRMLSPADLKGKACYRVRIQRPDGVAVLWIEQSTGLLLRAQLPPEMLLQTLEGQKPSVCTLTAELHNAKLDTAIPAEAFRMDIPAGTEIVEQYIPPQIRLLGQTLPPMQFSVIKAAPAEAGSSVVNAASIVTNQTLSGKVSVLSFWGCRNRLSQLNAPALESVRKKFGSNPNVAFWSVSTDDVSVLDVQLNQTHYQWGLKTPIARDKDGQLSKQLGINTIPVLFLIGPEGTIETVEMGFNPMLEMDLGRKIEALLGGKSLAAEILTVREAEAESYRRQMKDWLQKGVYLDSQPQTAIPGTSVSSVSAPTTLKMTKLWTVTDIQNPGAILTEDTTDTSAGTIWVVENGKKAIELSPAGKKIAEKDLQLETLEVCSYIRQTVNKQGKRFYLAFAPGQQRIHVYDQKWKLMFHFPEKISSTTPDGIYDARWGDLQSGNPEPEIYIGYAGEQGIDCLNLNGEVLWSNRSVPMVFMLAPFHNRQQNQLLCAGSSGAISVVSADGKTFGQFSVGNQMLAAVYSQDILNTGNDQLCGLSVFNGVEQRIFGFDTQGKILWSYELPPGIHRRPVDYVLSGKIKAEESKYWIALGADGSVHFLDEDGILYDRFNHGSFIYGIAVGQFNGTTNLILSDEKGVSAWKME